jgi:hypothetical protein
LNIIFIEWLHIHHHLPLLFLNDNPPIVVIPGASYVPILLGGVSPHPNPFENFPGVIIFYQPVQELDLGEGSNP